MHQYTDTSGTLAKASDTTGTTVNAYANLGLLDFVTASNGTRLFRTGQADMVRRLKAERSAHRPGRPRAA